MFWQHFHYCLIVYFLHLIIIANISKNFYQFIFKLQKTNPLITIIIVYLISGSSVPKTIDALYAFSQCEVSISPLSCIISNNKPEFIGVSDILRTSTENTRELLKEELEIELDELNNQWHNISLEKIFIENRVYRDIEDKTSWESVLSAIEEGLKPYVKKLKKEVSLDDIKKLTEIPIKKISKFDLNKVNEKLKNIENRNLKFEMLFIRKRQSIIHRLKMY